MTNLSNWRTLWFLTKVFFHFIYVLIIQALGFKQSYKLNFVKEDGWWFIDFPSWPFSHDNLAMVCGADDLCEYLDKDGDGKLTVKVVASNRELGHKYDEYIRCDREWARLADGGQYLVPVFNDIPVKELWLCQVTLFVIGWWPKYIYVK